MRCDAIRTSAMREVCWVVALADLVWHRLACIAGDTITPLEMRSDTLRSTHGTAGFLQQGIFDLPQQMPWSLAVGDVEAHLQRLEVQPEPRELVSRRIWRMLRTRRRRSDVVSAIKLWSHIRFTAITIEQDHAACSIYRRYHHEHGVAILTSLVMAYFMRVLVRQPRKDPVERMHERALKALLRKVPSRLHGQNIYLRDLSAQTSMKYAADTLEIRQAAHEAAIRQHVALYDMLPEEVIRMYEDAAATEIATKEESLLTAYQHHWENLAQHRRRAKVDAVDSYSPLVLGNMRFQDGDFDMLQRIWDDHLLYSKRRVDELRALALTGQRRPPVEEQTALIARPAGIGKLRRFLHGRHKYVALEAPAFGRCCFFSDGEPPVVRSYQVVRIQASPFEVCLLPLERFQWEEPLPLEREAWERARALRHEWDFTSTRGVYLMHWDVPLTPTTNVSILNHTVNGTD